MKFFLKWSLLEGPPVLAGFLLSFFPCTASLPCPLHVPRSRLAPCLSNPPVSWPHSLWNPPSFLLQSGFLPLRPPAWHHSRTCLYDYPRLDFLSLDLASSLLVVSSIFWKNLRAFPERGAWHGRNAFGVLKTSKNVFIQLLRPVDNLTRYRIASSPSEPCRPVPRSSGLQTCCGDISCLP